MAVRLRSFHRVKVYQAVATALLVVATASFANGLDLSMCTKSTLFLAFSWHSTLFSWGTFLQSFSEVLAILGVLLCFGGFCYLAAVLLEVFRTCRRTVVHRRRALRRAKSDATDGGANRLDPSRVEYWEGRSLGRGISLFLPDGSRQKELLKSWTQQESIAVLGTGSYFLKQTHRLLWRDIPDEMIGHLGSDDSVVYAALGPEKQYFLRFRDGDTCWSLWSELSQQIKEQEQKHHRVSVVCIAPKGGYFVLFDSGGWAHNRLPDSLRLFLGQHRERLQEVDSMSCSDSGAWFVSFRDGKLPRWHCDHLPRRLNDRILQLSGGDWKIQSLEFGFDGSWLLRFDGSPV